jgi:myo-inositol 2-dehydrogenase/D-chiro-inositol 1-dehydrogenase
MLEFAVFGAGRIGTIHAGNIARHPQARLRYVVDPNEAAAKMLARHHEAEAADATTVFGDARVGAVLIASSTDTHADLCIAAAKAGKAIFCEKPIDLSLSRVDDCLAAVRAAAVPLLVGFNRRFDPSFRSLKTRIEQGAIGAVEQVIITSRDPGPPPLAYLKTSGGLFRDMTIHDFDMGRWLLGEEPETVVAAASCLVDPGIGAAGDVDSAMIVMRTRSGRLCHINNSRRATYGYDQRIEVHGSKGRLMAANRVPTTVELANAEAISTEKPLHFFLERYAEAYRHEVDAFIAAVREGRPMPVGPEDGRRALVLAEAALESVGTGRAVRVES